LFKSHAKARRRKKNRKGRQNEEPSRLSLRLCAFAGRILVPVFMFLSITPHANAADLVTVTVLKPGEVKVEVPLSSPARSWSFRNAYAGVLGIAERVEDFRATTASEQDAGAKRIATGEFRSELDARSISYKVRLGQPTAADVSHVSWLVGDYGLLMLADLLPQDFAGVSVKFELPEGWFVESSSTTVGSGVYDVAVPEKAIFCVGRSLRKAIQSVEGMPLTMLVAGSWPFKDSDALNAAGKVMKKYLELTGFKLPAGAFVMIAPLPVKVGSTKWRAETRGSTVVLLMDGSANFQNWRGQLAVVFTHELLHLWVPNALKLEGDYDWFFEGFTLYIALRTALDLNVINFKEYLDTMARVYDSYLSYGEDISLLDASERRWTTPGSFVYDKGLLVAFLYDLMVRKESGGTTTLADKYRALFSRPAAEHANGNEVIIALLGSSPATKDLTKTYIENGTKLELERLLPPYGFTLNSSGKSAQLRVSRDLNSDQKQLLRLLGYRD